MLSVRALDGNIQAVAIAAERALFEYVKRTTGIEIQQGGAVEIEHDNKVLGAILAYSKAHNNCRYAYDLTWLMPQDFVLRDRLEQYLYPGTIVKQLLSRD